MSVRMRKWAGIIQEAASSGMTKNEFCERNGIDRSQFYHWQKRIREFVLEHNPQLGLPPSQGQMQQIRATNSQVIASLPVFCELKPKEEELPEIPLTSEVPVSSFSATVMIQFQGFQIYVTDSATEKTLTLILSVIQHA